jgi:hypothetical protein
VATFCLNSHRTGVSATPTNHCDLDILGGERETSGQRQAKDPGQPAGGGPAHQAPGPASPAGRGTEAGRTQLGRGSFRFRHRGAHVRPRGCVGAGW